MACGRCHVGVTQQARQRSHIATILQKAGGEGVLEGVGCHLFLDAGAPFGFGNQALHIACAQRLP